MDISSILGSLSQDEIDGLRKTAEAIFTQEDVSSLKNNMQIPGMDAGAIQRITKISQAFSRNDERTQLIGAIKPFLKENRRRRADEAISFLRMMNAMRYLQEGDDGNG